METQKVISNTEFYPRYYSFMKEEGIKKEEHYKSLPYQKTALEILKNLKQGNGIFYGVASRQNPNQPDFTSSLLLGFN